MAVSNRVNQAEIFIIGINLGKLLTLVSHEQNYKVFTENCVDKFCLILVVGGVDW